jgi:hypothetical protein
MRVDGRKEHDQVVTGISGSRVLTWTGESNSNTERAQGDKFLAVNDLNGHTARGVRAVKAFKSYSMRGTPINCQVGRSFTAKFLFG